MAVREVQMFAFAGSGLRMSLLDAGKPTNPKYVGKDFYISESPTKFSISLFAAKPLHTAFHPIEECAKHFYFVFFNCLSAFAVVRQVMTRRMRLPGIWQRCLELYNHEEFLIFFYIKETAVSFMGRVVSQWLRAFRKYLPPPFSLLP